MSLVGNLHDLGLGEILQIVSLSRKSGLLSLSHRDKKAELLFRRGDVIRASSSDVPARLGELLLSRDVVDSATLARALALQAEEGYRRLLGAILVEFGVSAQAIEDVVREQIETAVFGLFDWDEGAFEFEIREVAALPDAVRVDPLQLVIDLGVSPQWLAMEGTRILDEKRHSAEEGEEVDFAFNLIPEAPAAAAEPAATVNRTGPSDARAAEGVKELRRPSPELSQGRPLILVDDDPATLQALEGVLSRAGYAVTPAGGGEAALIALDTMYAEGVRPVLVVDLVMPRMDGTGLFGGLEFLELVQHNFPDVSPLAVTDLRDEEAEATLRELSVPLLDKPARGAEDGFAGSLERALGADGAPLDLGQELRQELGEAAEPPEPAPAAAAEEPGLSGMLEELRQPALGGGVILLALRFAARFLNRGVIFLVGREGIVGAGEFGIDSGDGRAAARIRSLKVPTQAPSVLATVAASGRPFKGVVPEARWNDVLLKELGEGRPVEAFAAPIVSAGKVVAILYGDNLPNYTPIGETDALEIFLSQAGVAMEKAFLKRTLQEQGQEET
ncbi:response regulator [Geomesophilobacter sediminis]|uniref:DUF4388 domain-containing protein n=1 Tax=Geomesophilobacter sediminis TaxID=2798584 RepID=A0A8J7S8L0_9BACT|nr:response regulator [Geomesophilobacter sediminis]MBJ6727721.1 DUF4388 domain-containing protein [Geomesophilobacter sediminis]